MYGSRAFLLAVGLLATACLDFNAIAVRHSVDAGAMDADSAETSADAGPVDAGAVETSSDAGSVDAGAMDSGSMDAGADAGLPDAGSTDAGPVDAGSPDAGGPVAECEGGLVGDGVNCSPPFQQLAAGLGSTCGVRTDGTLWCWGNVSAHGVEYYGTLSSLSWQDHPVQIGLDADWASVVVERQTACALKDNGSLWCWGLGVPRHDNGSLSDLVAEPVRLDPPVQWRSVCVGRSGQCAVQADGTLWCHGENFPTDLALGDTSQRTALKQVGEETNWASVSCGEVASTCALKADHSLWCWGSSGAISATLGNISDTQRPTRVGTATNWSSVAVGGQVCALNDQGQVSCGGIYSNPGLMTWQGNDYVQVTVAMFGGGGKTGCGLKSDGSLLCWGNDDRGQFGNGVQATTSFPVAPTTSTPGHRWRSVTLAPDHGCGISLDGSAWCWGSNTAGQLGNGVAGATTTPTVLGGGAPFADYWVGLSSICVRDAWGVVSCSGAPNPNDWLPQPWDELRPVALSGSRDIALSAVGSCATIDNGDVKCWLSDDRRTYWNTVAGPGWVAVAGERDAMCALHRTGVVDCWVPSWLSNVRAFTTLSPLPLFSSFAIGGSYLCGLDAMGFASCGVVSFYSVLHFGSVGPIAGGPWRSLTLGSDGLCALAPDQTAWCTPSLWTQRSLTKVDDSTWLALASGRAATCGVRGDGALLCWSVGASEPDYVDAANDWRSVKGSPDNLNFCAQKQDGSVWCWGEDTWGQLANGRAWSLSPTVVTAEAAAP